MSNVNGSFSFTKKYSTSHKPSNAKYLNPFPVPCRYEAFSLPSSNQEYFPQYDNYKAPRSTNRFPNFISLPSQKVHDHISNRPPQPIPTKSLNRVDVAYGNTKPPILDNGFVERDTSWSWHKNWANDSCYEDDNVYSYAGQDLIPPAVMIKAQAIWDQANGSEENIYEEIPDIWSRKWHNNEILDELIADFQACQANGQRSISRPDRSNSPDSGLTITASETSSDRQMAGYTYSCGNLVAAGKVRLKRCESLDIKEIAGKRPQLYRRKGIRGKLKVYRNKLERTRFKILQMSNKDKRSFVELNENCSDVNGGSGSPCNTVPIADDLSDTRSSIRDSRSSKSSHSSHSSSLGGAWTEDKLYEDIGDVGANSTEGDEVGVWNSRRIASHRPLSSSDSWGSEEFESYSSNDDEADDKTSPQGNVAGNFKQRLLKKREQWKERRQSGRNLKFTLRKDSKEKDTKEWENDHDWPSTTENRGLSRWFSMRKNNYNVEKKCGTPDKMLSSYTLTNGTTPPFFANHRMPRLSEEDTDAFSTENFGAFEATFTTRQQPPTLPPMPQGLSPEQIKRRHIVSSIVHSENNYVATLQRLVNEYKKCLEESRPAVLSSVKISTMFFRVMEILQCHAMFRIELTECVRHWDKEEKIGDVFVASFSKAFILEVYSDFINNFSKAIDLAKQESKKKSAFADFLKMRQITSNDRLSLFGLLVKPVQRFPQFILFLQDLLKHTPHGHHDRMSLQLALTQMESLAEMLNERKREAEQYQAFKETLKHISTKFALRGLSEGNRYLLRQDDVIQLEFNQNGCVNKTKERRLFLTNDTVICVSAKSSDEVAQHGERLYLKWAHPVADVEITDTSSSPTLSRLLTAGFNKSAPRISEETGSDSLVQEMNDLMHDYQIVSRISSLVGELKGEYEGLNSEALNSISTNIQRSIQQKDEQMAYVDACCLQFSIKGKEGKEKETFTFQTTHPTVKKDWIVELRLAQLALDKNNSPGWYLAESDRKPSAKQPLFVKSLPVFSSKHQTEVKCGCCYTVTALRPSRSSRQMTYLWLCSSDGVSSHLTVFTIQQVGLKEIVKVDLTEMCVSALQHVPALTCPSDDSPLKSHTVWMGTDSHRLFVYSGLEAERQTQLYSTSVPASVTTIKYHCDQVYVGLSNGTVQVYRRSISGTWLIEEPYTIELGSSPILSLLAISTHIYACCGVNVHVVDCFTSQILRSFEVQHETCGCIQMMAHSGIGLWIAQEKSSTICLYHTETFKHLQDINVASIVSKMLSQHGHTNTPAKIFVTSLIASKGLLWVGTNVGVALTIPLPRLEGVPMISGRANISFHAHLGAITFLLALQSQPTRPCVPALDARLVQEDRSSTVPPPVARFEKQQSDNSLLAKPIPKLRPQLSSPVMLRRTGRETARRVSKTLPRGLGNFMLSTSQECDVYGVCGALLNVQSYDEESLPNSDSLLTLSRYDSMRRSDPHLALPLQIPKGKACVKTARPRSLDLSTWSIDSRGSSACTSSCDEPQSQPTPPKVYQRKDELARTLLVVSGGRGYVNWHRSESPSLPNVKDAHIIVWEMKL